MKQTACRGSCICMGIERVGGWNPGKGVRFRERLGNIMKCAWLFGTTKFTQGKNKGKRLLLHLPDLCCDSWPSVFMEAAGSIFFGNQQGHGRYKKHFPCQVIWIICSYTYIAYLAIDLTKKWPEYNWPDVVMGMMEMTIWYIFRHVFVPVSNFILVMANNPSILRKNVRKIASILCLYFVFCLAGPPARLQLR